MLPLDISGEVKHILGGTGDVAGGNQYIGTVSKSIDIGDVNLGELGTWKTGASVDMSVVCEDQFFGNTACPSNIIYG